MSALGHNHAFETAIADLVDNSIDARARVVLVRFVRSGRILRSVYVVDDGHGISHQEIDGAMTLGGEREYQSGDLGHFGLGLKAASLSQASSFTLLSRKNGQVSGRRWAVDKTRPGFDCDVVDQEFCESEISRPWNSVTIKDGTVVRWDGLRGVPVSAEPTEAFLTDRCVLLSRHLGLVFHRLLAAERVRILIDTEEGETGETGPLIEVQAIDPFGYLRSGARDYPKVFLGELGSHQLKLTCHVWPGRSSLKEYRLNGKPEDFQGFFLYRNGRLINAGGWHGVQHARRELQLARVEIDLDDSTARHAQMNPEKSKVVTDAAFAAAIEGAIATDGTDLRRFFQVAEAAYRESMRRDTKRKKVVRPDRGFDPIIRKAIHEELEFWDDQDSVSIRWKRLESPSFFDIDRDDRIILLNERYRRILLGDRRGGLNDAPLIKTLMFLLMEDIFRGERHGSRDKDNVELWRELLTAAIEAETQ